VATEQFRELTLVGLHVDNDTSTVVGWGECSALNEPGYTPEWAEGAFDLLRSGSAFDRTTAPMATSAVEMGLLDFELKQAGESLADRLGTAGLSAPAGAVVGLGPLPSMLDAVEAASSCQSRPFAPRSPTSSSTSTRMGRWRRRIYRHSSRFVTWAYVP